MRRAPRAPDETVLSGRFLRAISGYAALITAATLVAYVWSLSGTDESRAVTVAFTTLALAQVLHLGNARSRGPVVAWRRVVANPWALGAVPLVIGLQLAAVYWQPLSSVLRTVPLTPSDWMLVFGLAAVPAVAGQASEWLQRREATA